MEVRSDSSDEVKQVRDYSITITSNSDNFSGRDHSLVESSQISRRTDDFTDLGSQYLSDHQENPVNNRTIQLHQGSVEIDPGHNQEEESIPKPRYYRILRWLLLAVLAAIISYVISEIITLVRE